MIIQVENHEPDMIDECDLRTLGIQLLRMVYVYRNEVVITSQEIEDRLNKLETIGRLILNKRYDELIMDPTLISMIKPDVTSNDYLNLSKYVTL